jgi:pyruvate,water dikinase
MVVLPGAQRKEIASGLGPFLKPQRRYALRSSANVEDGAEWSFAGQFTTVLGVEGLEDVLDGVERVRASANDPPDVYFQRAGVAPDDLRMAVIVQELVPAKRSGVAFSRNPMTGLDEIVIEEVDGLGEGLVAGRVVPYRWIRRWGAWTTRPDDRNPVVAEAAADLVAGIARKRRYPVDVEWAHDGKEIFALQVRPQTGGSVPVYSNRISREVLPGLIKPLVWSINVPIVNSAWIDLFTSLIGPNDLEPEDLARSFAYRAYFNMQAVGDVFEAMGMPRDVLEVLMGLEGGDERPTFRPGLKVLRHLPRMARTGLRLARYRKELERELMKLEAEFGEIEQEDPAHLTDGGLLTRIEDLERLSKRAAFANIVAPLLMSFYHRRFRKKATAAGEDADAIDPALGDSRLEVFDPNPHLDDLASVFRSFSAERRSTVQADPDDFPGLGEFLERFGHLSDSGNDFSSQPWRENPDALLAMVASRPSGKVTERAIPPDLGRAARKAADFRVAREHVSYVYTRGYGLHRGIFLEMGRRLTERGRLSRPDDVFYLTIQEVRGAMVGEEGDFAALTAKRRDEMDALADLAMPEIIYGDSFTPAPPADPDHRLYGLATSRGVAAGTARVIKTVEEHHRVEQGDVIVIPYSDVAWTAMFAKASAVVAEAGGMLSHSSIVAREMRIPCVVSVDQATRIPDGCKIYVDGFSGEVRWTPT